MINVTLDTNILPADDLIAVVPADRFEFGVVSVTERELQASPDLVPAASVNRVPETAVWGESVWGGAVLGGERDDECLEEVLIIIGDGSFPRPDRRAALTDGQRRQLRDAMILCAHVRARRQIFVSDDARGFIRGNRRAKLEQALATRILTRAEFISEFGTK